jgi:thiamine pyrophosphate-dependent acetolactate synthase large subunit-like protein
MARPKETDEQKVKKVYPHAKIIENVDIDWDNGGKILDDNVFSVINYTITKSNEKRWREISERLATPDLAWQDALTQIRKAKIKAAKDKRKQAKPAKVKEIKKHVGLTMYPSDKAIIVKGFGSVQKFLDLSIREYKDRK